MKAVLLFPCLLASNCHNNKPYLRRLIYFPEVLSKQKGLWIWTDDLHLTLSNDHYHSSVVIMRIENSRFSAKPNQFYPFSWKLTDYKSTFSRTHTYIRFENLISWVVTRAQRSTPHGGLDRWRDAFDETSVSARIPVPLHVSLERYHVMSSNRCGIEALTSASLPPVPPPSELFLLFSSGLFSLFFFVGKNWLGTWLLRRRRIQRLHDIRIRGWVPTMVMLVIPLILIIPWTAYRRDVNGRPVLMEGKAVRRALYVARRFLKCIFKIAYNQMTSGLLW
jgi:hypothetical protein